MIKYLFELCSALRIDNYWIQEVIVFVHESGKRWVKKSVYIGYVLYSYCSLLLRTYVLRGVIRYDGGCCVLYDVLYDVVNTICYGLWFALLFYFVYCVEWKLASLDTLILS